VVKGQTDCAWTFRGNHPSKEEDKNVGQSQLQSSPLHQRPLKILITRERPHIGQESTVGCLTGKSEDRRKKERYLAI